MLRSRMHAPALDRTRSRCFLQVENMTCSNLISPSALKNQLSKETESVSDRTKVRTMNVIVRFFGHALEKDKPFVSRPSKHVSVGNKQQIGPQWKDKMTVLLRYNNAKRLAKEVIFVQLVDRGDSGIETVLGYGAIHLNFPAAENGINQSSTASPKAEGLSIGNISSAPLPGPPVIPTAGSKPPPIPPRLAPKASAAPKASPSASPRTLRGEKLAMTFQCPITYSGHFTGLLQGTLTVFSGTLMHFFRLLLFNKNDQFLIFILCKYSLSLFMIRCLFCRGNWSSPQSCRRRREQSLLTRGSDRRG